jgi:transposase
MVHDLRQTVRWAAGLMIQPTAANFDSDTRQSTPESGHRAGYDGDNRRKGSTMPLAVDTLGEVLVLLVTPADAQDRDQVAALAKAGQEATGSTVQVVVVDQGYTGAAPAADAATHGIRLEVVKLPEAKRGFVLLPRRRRWVVERSFAWASRFRRLTKDYDRVPDIVAGLHCVAFISWPLSVSCSIDYSLSPRKVHNTL